MNFVTENPQHYQNLKINFKLVSCPQIYAAFNITSKLCKSDTNWINGY